VEAHEAIEGGEEAMEFGRGSPEREVAGYDGRLEREVRGGGKYWRGGNGERVEGKVEGERDEARGFVRERSKRL
jgi:hypothetical protein